MHTTQPYAPGKRAVHKNQQICDLITLFFLYFPFKVSAREHKIKNSLGGRNG